MNFLAFQGICMVKFHQGTWQNKNLKLYESRIYFSPWIKIRHSTTCKPFTWKKQRQVAKTKCLGCLEGCTRNRPWPRKDNASYASYPSLVRVDVIPLQAFRTLIGMWDTIIGWFILSNAAVPNSQALMTNYQNFPQKLWAYLPQAMSRHVVGTTSLASPRCAYNDNFLYNL